VSVVFVGTQWCQQVALAQEAELRERAADCSSGPKNDLMIRAADTEGAGILGLVRGCWLVVPGADIRRRREVHWMEIAQPIGMCKRNSCAAHIRRRLTWVREMRCGRDL
jgi:hypothetical protein